MAEAKTVYSISVYWCAAIAIIGCCISPGSADVCASPYNKGPLACSKVDETGDAKFLLDVARKIVEYGNLRNPGVIEGLFRQRLLKHMIYGPGRDAKANVLTETPKYLVEILFSSEFEDPNKPWLVLREAVHNSGVIFNGRNVAAALDATRFVAQACPSSKVLSSYLSHTETLDSGEYTPRLAPAPYGYEFNAPTIFTQIVQIHGNGALAGCGNSMWASAEPVTNGRILRSKGAI